MGSPGYGVQAGEVLRAIAVRDPQVVHAVRQPLEPEVAVVVGLSGVSAAVGALEERHHVALVAVVEAESRAAIVAGGRYVVLRPGVAEVAFVVVDDFQRQGIGAVLLRHLAAIARAAGVKELVAEVLPDNIPMLKVFEKSGLKLLTKREPGVVHVALQLS